MLHLKYPAYLQFLFWMSGSSLPELAVCPFLHKHPETYRQYTETQKALEQRNEEECRKRQQETEQQKQISPEVQEVLDKGEAYIQKIHASNDAIPGEEISAKIARMEQIVEQIFQRAEEHPEIIPDLKKMMDYYLPMPVPSGFSRVESY